MLPDTSPMRPITINGEGAMYKEAMLETGGYRQGLESTQRTLDATKVAILLAAYNGDRFLDDQLQSIIHQSHENWLIVVSDDGSTDSTRALLQRYQRQIGEQRLRVVEGPRRGFVSNFMAMASDPEIEADYFAFSDQDDIWHRDHLERALAWLQTVDPAIPALHCGRTRLVHEDGRPFGMSPLFPKAPHFKNALVQSLAGGNTMVFNRSARQLLSHTAELPIVSHDWWLYMLVSGTTGRIRYCEQPSVDYRQHSNNLVGSNSDLKDRLHRIRRMLAGHFHTWNTINVDALSQCRDLLSDESCHTFHTFAAARRAGLLSRLHGMQRCGVYRQTLPGNMALVLAALLGKL
ncbi:MULTISPECIES: glycosyltransferase family 2 protein [unclassified Pseudomonas]|uniref:glycosyltransferase family 2 protein n=1 Tax=unclassified Pseudomonas TaxID=196821 RepID=UPI00244BCA0E|nr:MULTISPECIES: glycosyltransferase family 2 protein [unclassified Pseudomonas]MDG9929187.1 glycosyltransferase family 2 protein [Pseudomonas sp. GD04042]MDH0484031.1 glycosyltransferase family 2 protein [Pseudomonas sp. GD04015]MDH0605839.1 glycosyltransferase family 2 protein [Pseudomonas sp. GD03869]